MDKLIEIEGQQRPDGFTRLSLKVGFISAVQLVANSDHKKIRVGYYENFIEFYYPSLNEAVMQFETIKKAMADFQNYKQSRSKRKTN